MRRILISALMALSVVGLGAQWGYVNTLDDVSVTGTAAAVFASADVRAGSGHPQADLATCSLTTANIRVTTDGSTPTTSYGEVLVPGNYVFQGNQVLLALNAIRDDSTSATLSCTLYGGGR